MKLLSCRTTLFVPSDQFSKTGNPGLDNARLAAQAVGGKVALYEARRFLAMDRKPAKLPSRSSAAVS